MSKPPEFLLDDYIYANHSVGQILYARREYFGLGFDQISHDLNIRVEFLEALENDRYDTLPGYAYAIGFVRAYADYLEIDSERLVQYFKSLKEQKIHTKRAELSPAAHDLNTPKPMLVVASFCVFLACTLFFKPQTQPIQVAPIAQNALNQQANQDNETQQITDTPNEYAE